ncbi:tetratricopeptide repeat protein [Marinobacterium aestuariivivens]|uniref:Tetratricopeptide repeat protein n=1 Tax=Marinobacterium aestuariivivens TaxID=1698799 RepID=A0ABW2A925_9GAMM
MPTTLKLVAAALLLYALAGTLQQASAARADVATPEAAAHDDSLQAQFLLGAMALQNGDFDAAIAIFSDLARKTSSPRIQLELARALFLARRFEESKQLFDRVSARADTPGMFARTSGSIWMRSISPWVSSTSPFPWSATPTRVTSPMPRKSR